MKIDNTNLLDDVYYNNDYSSLYLDEHSSVFESRYSEGDQWVIFRSVKKLIAQVAGLDVDEELYDLETHYGYGGPVSNSLSADFLERAFQSYREYCVEQKIVCEFVRFHPFNDLASMAQLYDMHVQERSVVVVDLTLDTDDRWKHYSKNTRNILRKAQNTLLCRKNELRPRDFMALYKQTMDKNNADTFYYFDNAYFERLSGLPGVDLLDVSFEGNIASCGYFMHGKDLGHYHLSANNAEYASVNGNYLLLDYAFENARQRGCKYMMLGGGRTSAADDSLFRFKSRFSDTHMPFYIAGLNFMPQQRRKLNDMWSSVHAGTPPKLFQQYRY